MMIPRSIRARMTASFTTSIALLMLIVCSGTVIYIRHNVENNARSLLDGTIEEIEQQSTDQSGHISYPTFIKAANVELAADRLVMAIYDHHGKLIHKSQPLVPQYPPRNSRDWRVKAVPVEDYVVVMAFSWVETEQNLHNLIIILIFLALFVTLLTASGAWVLVGRTLTPISQVSRQAQAASADCLSVKLATPSEDSEIVELVGTLNGLLNRISQTALSKSRFYSSASHELRTPLQALLGHLELAIARPRTSDDYRAAIEESYSQTKRLVSLVEDLLLLSRLDSTVSLPPEEPVDLVSICERTIAYYQQLISDRKLKIASDFPSEAPAECRSTHAQMLIRNLVENAVKYATTGGQVSLSIFANSSSGHRFEISNTFDGVEELSSDEIFEPFFRPDSSRNSKNGLGLAICKAIALANGWTISLEHQASVVKVVVTF